MRPASGQCNRSVSSIGKGTVGRVAIALQLPRIELFAAGTEDPFDQQINLLTQERVLAAGIPATPAGIVAVGGRVLFRVVSLTANSDQ